jgi:hypothetical protein
VCATRRSGIGRIVGEPDCALFCAGYGLKSRASGVRGENCRDFAWMDGDHEDRRGHMSIAIVTIYQSFWSVYENRWDAPMRDYTLEGGHFAEDEKKDEDSSNGDGPEERREPL